MKRTKIFKNFNAETVKIILRGGIGVIPTDTIYGIVCSAFSKKAVERVYRLRKRSPKKPVIVLISSRFGVRMFGADLDRRTSNILNNVWPGPISVIFPVSGLRSPVSKFRYLHRGKNAIAFRLPAKASLRKFLKMTGPLIAPSANLEGKKPARTAKEAQKYFGNKIDFYVDGGKLRSKPSTLVSFKNGKLRVIRPGAAKVKGANLF